MRSDRFYPITRRAIWARRADHDQMLKAMRTWGSSRIMVSNAMTEMNICAALTSHESTFIKHTLYMYLY